VGIGAFGDAELGFDAVNGLLEHVALDGGDVVMKAEGPANDAGQVDYNPASLENLRCRNRMRRLYSYWRISMPIGSREERAVLAPKLLLFNTLESSAA
jgi:hypothetical protein